MFCDVKASVIIGGVTQNWGNGMNHPELRESLSNNPDLTPSPIFEDGHLPVFGALISEFRDFVSRKYRLVPKQTIVYTIRDIIRGRMAAMLKNVGKLKTGAPFTNIV